MNAPSRQSVIDPDTERQLAKFLFNRVWELLERPVRTIDENDEMVNAAYASRYHWSVVGGAAEAAIGEWQISRVYATLDRAEPAVHHARRCQQIANSGDDSIDTWLVASSFEGLARAHFVSGDLIAAREFKREAVDQLEHITDAEDREAVERDIASLPE